MKDDDSILGRTLYKILTELSGQDLQQTKREQIRQKRKEFIEQKELLGGPPFHSEQTMEVLVELGLKEAECIDNFNPDLLIVSRPQYKELANIGAGVPLDVDKAEEFVPGPTDGLQAVQPPMFRRFGTFNIATTFSDSTDRMLLVESEQLSTEVRL